ncbi:uncharacterized protein Dana_GF26280, isoform A [Drosophila ananassae]|uniref:Uncharacterized protein, isoform A n=1 Tax=Drosophila ananassae TaxID=7217 RepID=A0A0P8ZVA1_DROAN|nr:uncharacterized protein Dana_GF26280, isoform A [Drosophila ananassae]
MQNVAERSDGVEVDPTAMRNARNQPKTNVRCIQKLTANGLYSLCELYLASLFLSSSPPPMGTEKCNQLEAKNVRM